MRQVNSGALSVSSLLRMGSEELYWLLQQGSLKDLHFATI